MTKFFVSEAVSLTAPQQVVRTICRWALPLYCFFVSYCALVPFQNWTIPEHNIFDVLMYGWVDHIYMFDIIQNVLLYLPMGFFVVFGMANKQWVLALVYSLLISFFISSLLEFVQSYNPARIQSALDIIFNSLGGMLGGVMALILYKPCIKTFNYIGTDLLFPYSIEHPLSLISLLMIISWGGYQWYPFLPTLHPTHMEQGYTLLISSFRDWQNLDSNRFLSYFAQVVMLYALSLFCFRDKHFWILLAFITIILPFKILIIGRVLSFEAILGSYSALIFASLMHVFLNRVGFKLFPNNTTQDPFP